MDRLYSPSAGPHWFALWCRLTLAHFSLQVDLSVARTRCTRAYVCTRVPGFHFQQLDADNIDNTDAVHRIGGTARTRRRRQVLNAREKRLATPRAPCAASFACGGARRADGSNALGGSHEALCHALRCAASRTVVASMRDEGHECVRLRGQQALQRDEGPGRHGLRHLPCEEQSSASNLRQGAQELGWLV